MYVGTLRILSLWSNANVQEQKTRDAADTDIRSHGLVVLRDSSVYEKTQHTIYSRKEIILWISCSAKWTLSSGT